jgi:hypothetical protein
MRLLTPGQARSLENISSGCLTTNRKAIGNHIHRLNAIDARNGIAKRQGIDSEGYTSFNRMFAGTLPLAPL